MLGDTSLSPKIQQLNGLYQKALLDYEERAARWKWRHHAVWAVPTTGTWVILLLGIAGLRWPGLWGFDKPILHWILPALSILVTVATLLQTVGRFRERWLSARAAVEQLWHACIRYRMRLKPFDGGDAEEVFLQEIKDIRAAADRGVGRRIWERFSWRYFKDLLFMPPDLREPLAHVPGEGVWPRNGDNGEIGDYLVSQGRLRSQRQWHLKKARTFLFRYSLFQTVIFLVALVDSSCIWFDGIRRFEVFAFTTAFNLMLMAWRDFLGHQALMLLYVKVAGNLRDMEQAYVDRQEPFGGNDPPARMERLVEELEVTLNGQFQHWYASRR